MEKCFLTNGGNLLRFHPSNKFYFQKPDGEFIREVSNSEAEYLSQQCTKIQGNFANHPEFLPRWHFIKSVLVTQNNSNYRAEMSSNGGCYCFHTYHDWYVSRYPNGTYEFCFVGRHTTSSDFSYTELGGNFNSNPGTCYLLNVQGEVSYTMGCASHDEVIEKIGHVSSLEHLWSEMYQYIPPQEENESIELALSFSDKKEIVKKLKYLFESQDSLEEYTWEDFRKANAIARRRKSRGGGKRNIRR